MSSPFAAALAAARQALAVTVAYKTGAATVTLKAIRGQRPELLGEVEGAGVAFQSPDWICAAADLVTNGTPIVPTVDHRIEYTNPAGTLEKYRVVKDISGRCFSNSDTEGTTLRIHTNRVQ